MDKNWIQKHILRQLTLHSTRRYSQLKPDDVEGNLFMYHLSLLVKEGYVHKENKNYSLTPVKGLAYAAIINISSGEPRQLPKIVLMFYISDKDGRVLLFKWKRQPYINQLSLPYGRIDFGTPIAEAVALELHKKTNLTGKLNYKKDYYLMVKREGTVINHMIAQLFELKQAKGELKTNVFTGDPIWVVPSKLKDLNLAPGTPEILKDIQSKNKEKLTEIIVDYK